MYMYIRDTLTVTVVEVGVVMGGVSDRGTCCLLCMRLPLNNKRGRREM